jgi:hypothetical protein
VTKSIFAFQKPPRAVWWECFDDPDKGGEEKDHHEWQQSAGEAAYFIERRSTPRGIVCDPFAGSGTALAAAKNLGRCWIGLETDEQTVITVRGRVAAELAPAEAG